MKFYFTYGTEGHPFKGGWTEVEADDFDGAVKLFALAHPSKNSGLLNCSSAYAEEEFFHTCMARNGNFGKKCVERIKLIVEVLS